MYKTDKKKILKLKLRRNKFKFKFKLSFIVIPLHVGTYSGTKCRASQDHGATLIQTYNNEVKHYKPIHN